MRAKLCLFMLLALLSPIASAEYYLVYSVSDCYGGGCGYVPRHHYHTNTCRTHHHHAVYHHRRSGYTISVYYYFPPAPCVSCGCGGCNDGPCGVYTAAPAHCVTYDEVMTGYRYRDDFMDP